MRPCAGTVGRAVFGLVAVLVGRGAPTSAPGGFAAYSDNGSLTIDAHAAARARAFLFE